MPQITLTMGIIIGIDVGISTTKIVGLKNGRVVSPIRITAADQVTSLYGAFGKYLHDNNLQLEEIEHVMLTGVGAAYVKGDVYGVKTSRCDEFVADALGARYESRLDHAIVVSPPYRRHWHWWRHPAGSQSYHAEYQRHQAGV